MNLTALGRRIVVAPEPPRTKTVSGFALPPSAIRPSYTGTVVSVGPGVTKHVPLKPGMRVAFWPYRGTEFWVEGKPLRVLELGDMIGAIGETSVAALDL
jgi:chaperonin GroES